MIGAHRTLKGELVVRRNETPLRRVNPGGAVVWVARWTNEAGERASAGTFPVKGPCRRARDDGKCCAQHRIWWAYEQDGPRRVEDVTVREYATETWLQRHPRPFRTEMGYVGRLKAIMDEETKDGIFGDLPMVAVRPRHLNELVDIMLREHGRAASGTRAVIAVLSAMWRDAIMDEIVEINPALMVRVRDKDPRVQKPKRKVNVVTLDQMHDFARAAGEYEPMIRTLSDTGLRLGEMLGLERQHLEGDVLRVCQKAWHGQIVPGTKQSDSRVVPVGATLLAMLEAIPPRLGTRLLFPDPKGRPWHERTFYRVIWYPTQERTGLRIRPHDMRHSFVSEMRAAGVDPGDLAVICGHTVNTATRVYTHAMGRSLEKMMAAIPG